MAVSIPRLLPVSIRLLKGVAVVCIALIPCIPIAARPGSVDVITLMGAMLVAPWVLPILIGLLLLARAWDTLRGTLEILGLWLLLSLADHTRVMLLRPNLTDGAAISADLAQIRTLIIYGDSSHVPIFHLITSGRLDAVFDITGKQARRTALAHGSDCAKVASTTSFFSNDRMVGPDTCTLTTRDVPPGDGLVLRKEVSSFSSVDLGCCNVLRGFRRVNGVEALLFTLREGHARALAFSPVPLSFDDVGRALFYRPITFGYPVSLDAAVRAIYYGERL